jgi:hypothetical protein
MYINNYMTIEKWAEAIEKENKLATNVLLTLTHFEGLLMVMERNLHDKLVIFGDAFSDHYYISPSYGGGSRLRRLSNNI